MGRPPWSLFRLDARGQGLQKYDDGGIDIDRQQFRVLR